RLFGIEHCRGRRAAPTWSVRTRRACRCNQTLDCPGWAPGHEALGLFLHQHAKPVGAWPGYGVAGLLFAGHLVPAAFLDVSGSFPRVDRPQLLEPALI